jgi:hypothetical protein
MQHKQDEDIAYQCCLYSTQVAILQRIALLSDFLAKQFNTDLTIIINQFLEFKRQNASQTLVEEIIGYKFKKGNA